MIIPRVLTCDECGRERAVLGLSAGSYCTWICVDCLAKATAFMRAYGAGVEQMHEHLKMVSEGELVKEEAPAPAEEPVDDSTPTTEEPQEEVEPKVYVPTNTELRQWWNTEVHDKCPGIHKSQKVYGALRKKLITRCAEGFWDSREGIACSIQGSDFLQGTNDRNWKVTLQWLLSSEANWVKVLQGNYDSPETDAEPSADELAILDEAEEMPTSDDIPQVGEQPVPVEDEDDGTPIWETTVAPDEAQTTLGGILEREANGSC